MVVRCIGLDKGDGAIDGLEGRLLRTTHSVIRSDNIRTVSVHDLKRITGISHKTTCHRFLSGRSLLYTLTNSINGRLSSTLTDSMGSGSDMGQRFRRVTGTCVAFSFRSRRHCTLVFGSPSLRQGPASRLQRDLGRTFRHLMRLVRVNRTSGDVIGRSVRRRTGFI